jgi:Family of unknown function (DUF6111)
MIRPLLMEIGLFVAPFAAYALFLWASRMGVLDPEHWPLRTVVWLTAASLVLVAASFVVLAHISGTPLGSTYVPAHMENGRLVPETVR